MPYSNAMTRLLDGYRNLYSLPGDPATDLYAIPCSGGADSGALARLLTYLFPSTGFVYFFTDTLAEDQGIYRHLDDLEFELNQLSNAPKTIKRITPQQGLWQQIKTYKGYIPSSHQRWCTRLLKIKPMEEYLAARVGELPPGGKIHMFVGLRADEPERVGFISHKEFIETHFPFQDLGIGRDEVFRILSLSQSGVPQLYKWRSRSGCETCWGMRTYETLASLRHYPDGFQKGVETEKLALEDQGRFKRIANRVSWETGISDNWMTFPFPSLGKMLQNPEAYYGQVGTAPSSQRQPSLFGTVIVHAAAQFLVDVDLSGRPYIWDQELITFGNTRGSISKQLAKYYWHRKNTPEVYGLTQEAMDKHLRIVTYTLELPAALIDTGPLTKGSYTWRHGKSYEQLKHMASYICRTLMAAGLVQESRRHANAPPGSRANEYYNSIVEGLNKLDLDTVGSVLSVRLHKTPEVEPEESEGDYMCPVCAH